MPSVLLVEDDEMGRDMLSRRLARRGFDVRTAADGAEGEAEALRSPPDVILLDLRLPVVDGWQLIERLKSEATTRDVPLIALTAHALSQERQRCLDLGCNDFETKPVDFPRLLEKIWRAVESTGSR